MEEIIKGSTPFFQQIKEFCKQEKWTTSNTSIKIGL